MENLSPILGVGVSFLIAIFGFIVNKWSNKNKIKELEQAQIALQSKLDIDKQKADQDKKKNDADLSDHFLAIAKDSADQIRTLRAESAEQITCLEKEVKELQKHVKELISDKRRLEEESVLKDQRIGVLETENEKLRNRVEKLETALRSYGKPIPINGG